MKGFMLRYFVFICLICTQSVQASYLHGIKEFCESKNEYEKCIKDYEGIPKLEAIPELQDKNKHVPIPIPIRVIPFNDN